MFFSSFFLFTVPHYIDDLWLIQNANKDRKKDVTITFCFHDNDCNVRNTTNKNDRKQTLPVGILWYFGRCNHSLFSMKRYFREYSLK